MSQPALAKLATSSPMRSESAPSLYSQGTHPFPHGLHVEPTLAQTEPSARPAEPAAPPAMARLRSFHTLEDITVVDALVAHLEAEQVDTVFGIPGGNIAPLVQALRRHSRIRFVIGSHEGGSAFMADGYARATGRRGVCAVTAGPGAT
ncbi:MAG TPA: thiamine pyrophosphate-binding protein, partial [Archangium sp.]|uniref:thiamine pyrophosphate-binding protein n=1 Tax=Archangium sp. TaxID=1872627 RepID=UPI002ED95514